MIIYIYHMVCGVYIYHMVSGVSPYAHDGVPQKIPKDSAITSEIS